MPDAKTQSRNEMFFCLRLFVMAVGKESIMNKYLNYWGLIFVIVILIPNIVFAITCKDGFENRYQNKLVESLEQIGR